MLGRKRPRVVLWGGRERDIQFGSLRWRIHVIAEKYRVFTDGFGSYRWMPRGPSHGDHVHVATSDHFRGPLEVRIEPGTTRPDR